MRTRILCVVFMLVVIKVHLCVARWIDETDLPKTENRKAKLAINESRNASNLTGRLRTFALLETCRLIQAQTFILYFTITAVLTLRSFAVRVFRQNKYSPFYILPQ